MSHLNKRLHHNVMRVLLRSGMWLWLIVAACYPVSAADYRPPAGTHPARAAEKEAVLPGGRIVRPLGKQFVTGPGPFGLAISPGGGMVVSANGGPNKYSLTILDK